MYVVSLAGKNNKLARVVRKLYSKEKATEKILINNTYKPRSLLLEKNR